MGFRNVAYNTLTSRVPRSEERARFMSFQSAVQHIASSMGAFVSAKLLHELPDHHLVGLEHVVLISMSLTALVPALLIIVEARVIFAVPLRGSALLLLGEALLFILASLALGILVSTRTSSQRVAMMMAMAGTMLPNILLSGFIFPIESMPAPLQFVSNVVPGQWFVTIARGIMLKGVGLEYLWKETLVLAATAAVLLTMSALSLTVWFSSAFTATT